MKKIFNGIVRLRYFFLAFWGVLLIASIIMIPKVKINYDTTKYLPGDTKIKESLKIMEDEFGLTGQASLMIGDVTFRQAIDIKNILIKELKDDILEIMWLDSFVDQETLIWVEKEIKELDSMDLIDLGSIPGINQFYKDKKALFQIIFSESEYSINTGIAIEKIRSHLDKSSYQYAMSGTAVSAHYTRVMTSEEVFKVTQYVIPIILVILIIFTSSWAEPILFLLVVGTSVLVNMGTNIMFPSISFLTNSTASLLQLAISMDYAIFLLHQYTHQRELGLENKEAMKVAMSKSFLSINSSMLTTVAGFIALIFMRYTIGLDLSQVMIKGILLSIICTFTLMPPLILLFTKFIDATKHRPFFPGLERLTKIVYKLRFIIPLAIVLVLIPSYTSQNKNKFVYGEEAMSASEGTTLALEGEAIERVFGKSNQIVILLPREEGSEKELRVIKRIEENLASKRIDSTVQSLAALTNIKEYIPARPDLPFWDDFLDAIFSSEAIEDLIHDDFKKQLVTDNYSRVIISVATDSESEEAFEAVTAINTALHDMYGGSDFHIIGVSTSIQEIKDVVESDFKIVNLLSIGLVLLILIIAFRSLLVPIILVLCIQISVWINMSIPVLTDSKLIFIGYMIVSAVQLGATIDYGILLTQNYLNARKVMNKKAAFKESITKSGHSILTSALILAAAGLALKQFSTIEGVSALGGLIGRGALLSGFMVLFLLPQALYLLDKWVERTTYKAVFYKDEIVEVVD